MHHVGISVSDIERTIAFYRDMFGMEQACAVFPFGGPDFSAVMGLDDACARLSAAGVSIHCPVTTFAGGMKAI